MKQRLKNLPWSNKTHADTDFYNLSERCLNSGDSYWGNLGYWVHHQGDNAVAGLEFEQDDYVVACATLAHKLAHAVELDYNSYVFDVGFGCGDQLLLWLIEYQVGGVAGINYSLSQTELAKQRLLQAGFTQAANNVGQGSAADLSTASYSTASCNSQAFNRVLALDCAYHFPSRERFFHHSYQLLTANSNSAFLGLADIVLADEAISWPKRYLLNAMLTLSRIPRHNIVTLRQYEDQLRAAGFQQVSIEDITADVFIPFGQWINAFKHSIKNKKGAWLKYKITAEFLAWAYRKNVLRYVIVSAKV